MHLCLTGSGEIGQNCLEKTKGLDQPRHKIPNFFLKLEGCSFLKNCWVGLDTHIWAAIYFNAPFL